MDCYGLLDLSENKAILFVPKLDNLYRIWMDFDSKETQMTKYGIEVRYLEDLESTLASYTGTMFVNEGVNSDSNLTPQIPDNKYLEGRKVNKEHLFDILAESRVIKNNEEVEALRWAS